jgi:hypothetical protein
MKFNEDDVRKKCLSLFSSLVEEVPKVASIANLLSSSPLLVIGFIKIGNYFFYETKSGFFIYNAVVDVFTTWGYLREGVKSKIPLNNVSWVNKSGCITLKLRNKYILLLFYGINQEFIMSLAKSTCISRFFKVQDLKYPNRTNDLT